MASGVAKYATTKIPLIAEKKHETTIPNKEIKELRSYRGNMGGSVR